MNKFSILISFTTVCIGCVSAGLAYAGTDNLSESNNQEISWLTHLAKTGDSGAQLQLGLAYQKGQYGLNPDENTGLYWLSAAARNGNAYAADAVASQLAEDEPKMTAAALYWWQQAAQGGNADAEVHLGEYMMQQGADEKALPWLRMAADRGDPRARQDLETLYRTDDLAEADLQRGENPLAVLAQEVGSTSLKTLFSVWRVIAASSTYEQSAGPLISRAQQGDPVAEYQLAVRYRDGAWDVNRDPEKAMTWLQRAAAAGNKVALKDLAAYPLQTKD